MKKIPCEIYSRVVGYFQPVSQWNKGKREEFREREYLDLQKNSSEVKIGNTFRKDKV